MLIKSSTHPTTTIWTITHSPHGILDCTMLFNQWRHNYMHYQLGYLLGCQHWAILWASIHPLQNSYIWMQDFLWQNSQAISWIWSWFLREIENAAHIFSICRNESTLQGILILVYSTLTDSSLVNPLISFDMDLLFWICDNSATGHICNDSAPSRENLFLPSMKLDQQPEHRLWL